MILVVLAVFAPKDLTSSTSSASGGDAPSANTVTTPPAKPKPTPKPKPDFELLSSKGTGNEYGGEITGKIRNNTNREYGYAQVTFNLYDAAGNQVGTAMDNINNLKPGATWVFKAITLEDYHTYQFEEVSAF